MIIMLADVYGAFILCREPSPISITSFDHHNKLWRGWGGGANAIPILQMRKPGLGEAR